MDNNSTSYIALQEIGVIIDVKQCVECDVYKALGE